MDHLAIPTFTLILKTTPPSSLWMTDLAATQAMPTHMPFRSRMRLEFIMSPTGSRRGMENVGMLRLVMQLCVRVPILLLRLMDHAIDGSTFAFLGHRYPLMSILLHFIQHRCDMSASVLVLQICNLGETMTLNVSTVMRPLGSVGTGANIMIAVTIGPQSDSNEVLSFSLSHAHEKVTSVMVTLNDHSYYSI